MTPRPRTLTSGFHDFGGAVLLVLGITEEIEAPHLVRAVVRTEPRADAAVVDHQVEAGMIVHRGVYRTHDLARRLLAMHARHRLEREARVLRRPDVITVDAQPVHDPVVQHLFLADRRYVVFRLAGDHAGLAADAGIEVDRHAPGVQRIVEFRDRAISSRPPSGTIPGLRDTGSASPSRIRSSCPATRSKPWPSASGNRSPVRMNAVAGADHGSAAPRSRNASNPTPDAAPP